MMVVLVGMPGSGKTTWVKNNLLDSFIHINKDKIKNGGEIKLIKECIRDAQSFVIDGTNPSQTKREKYYKLASDAKYNITVIYFTRNGVGWNNLRENDKVPMVAYHMYYKNLVPPNPDNTPGTLFYM